MTSPFRFPPTVLAQHLAILGRTGSGKSYAAKGAVESLLADKRRVCIIDPTGIWYGLRSSADGKRAGFPVVVFGGPHADVAINELAGAALAKIIGGQNLPAIVDLSEMLIGQRHRFATDFAAALYTENRLPLHLVIDEADEFIPQNPLPETKRMLHHLDRIVRRGRVRGFRVMMITQRPAVLNKNVLTQSNALIAMRLTGPQDRLAMKAWIDGQGDPVTGKVVLDSLAQLKIGEGWMWAPELDMLQRVQFPPITTFDSGRTPDDDAPIAAPTKLAAVDISAITASFKAIEHEAATVKELQAELTKLRKQLAQSSVASAPPGVSEAEVRRRIDEAVAAVPKADPVVQQALTEALHTARASAQRIVEAVDAAQAHRASRETPFFKMAAARPAVIGVDIIVPKAATGPRPPAPAKAAPADGMTGPEQRIVDAIAWLEALGVPEPDHVPVAFLADYAPNGGSYNNARGRLNQRQLITYPWPGHVALTDAGRAVANAPGAAGSNEELQERVLAKLGGPEQRLLRPLIAAYPSSLSTQDLAAASGYTHGAGSFNNARGRLRSLGLIDYPQNGHVVALALLFPKGT